MTDPELDSLAAICAGEVAQACLCEDDAAHVLRRSIRRFEAGDAGIYGLRVMRQVLIGYAAEARVTDRARKRFDTCVKTLDGEIWSLENQRDTTPQPESLREGETPSNP